LIRKVSFLLGEQPTEVGEKKAQTTKGSFSGGGGVDAGSICPEI